MPIEPSQVTWLVAGAADPVVAELRESMGSERYRENRQALQKFLCRYFSSDAGCQKKLGQSVSPIGCPIDGKKALKVRWLMPGGGKSGALRLAVLLDCDARLVKIVGCWNRNTDPSNDDFSAALDS